MLDANVRIAGYACGAEAVPTCLLQCQLKTILLHKPILINYITNVLIFCVVFDNIFKNMRWRRCIRAFFGRKEVKRAAFIGGLM